MTSRQRIASILSAALFVAGVAFAATTTPAQTTPAPATPAPATPAPTTPAPTTPVTPALLWVFGDPTPQWLTLSYHESEAGCAQELATIKPSQEQDAGCFPVGVDPARLHDQYGAAPVPAVVK
jgi:hypothetical protein